MFRRFCAAVAALVALCVDVPAAARPFTVDDLLREHSFGATALDPTGRWLVIDRRDPYDGLGRYDHYLQMGAALSRLLFDLLAQGVSPLFAVGYAADSLERPRLSSIMPFVDGTVAS